MSLKFGFGRFISFHFGVCCDTVSLDDRLKVFINSIDESKSHPLKNEQNQRHHQYRDFNPLSGRDQVCWHTSVRCDVSIACR